MSVSVYNAIKRMREFTESGIPFSFSFYKYNAQGDGLGKVKHVFSAFIRKGYRDSTSVKSRQLIAYKDLSDESNRQCYVCLIKDFNNNNVHL